MRIETSRIRVAIVFLCLACVALVGCEEQRDTFGVDFIPEGERLKIEFETSTLIQTHTDTASLSPVRMFDVAPVGEIYGDIFGETRSILVTELYPTTLRIQRFEPTDVIDSAFFELSTRGAYYEGDVEVSVRLLKQGLGSDGAVLEDPSKEVLLASGEVKGGATRIKLPLSDAEWVKTFLGGAGTELVNFADWANYFAGIRIDVKRVGATGAGRMFSFDMGDLRNGLHFYWHRGKEGGELHLAPSLEGYCKRFYVVERNFQGAKVGKVLELGAEAQDKFGDFYVSGATKVFGVVDFSKFVEAWKEKSPTAINRAELLIPISKQNAGLSDTLVSQLNASMKVEGGYAVVPDLAQRQNLFGGYYNSRKGYYSLNITLFVQGILQGDITDRRIFIMPMGGGNGFRRVVLGNCQASGGAKMQLKLSYTEI